MSDAIFLSRDGAVATVTLNRSRKLNAMTRDMYRRSADPAPLDAAELEEAFDCCDSEDFRTGCRTFEAKRTPEFKGG